MNEGSELLFLAIVSIQWLSFVGIQCCFSFAFFQGWFEAETVGYTGGKSSWVLVRPINSCFRDWGWELSAQKISSKKYPGWDAPHRSPHFTFMYRSIRIDLIVSLNDIISFVIATVADRTMQIQMVTVFLWQLEGYYELMVADGWLQDTYRGSRKRRAEARKCIPMR